MSEANAVTARLEAHFGGGGLATRLTHCYARAPLKIAKTFRGERGLEVCLMDASPGLLAGDFYDLSWRLDEGADVKITTQGFTRVHPSRKRPCRLKQSFHVAPDAFLNYAPEPLMLYTDAALRSETSLKIAKGGAAVFSEILCAGRTGHNEAFCFDHFQSRFSVHYNDAPLFFNHVGFYPQRQNLRRIGAWGEFTHQGTFYVFSEACDAALRDQLRTTLEDFGNVLHGGVSLLQRHGIAALLMGRRAHDLQQAFAALTGVVQSSHR